MHQNKSALADTSPFGAFLQGGTSISEKVDVFCRYEWGDDAAGGPDLEVATVGTNWYLSGHKVKLTWDVGYGLNGVSAFWANSVNGWLEDPDGDNGQIVSRLQLQLLF